MREQACPAIVAEPEAVPPSDPGPRRSAARESSLRAPVATEGRPHLMVAEDSSTAAAPQPNATLPHRSAHEPHVSPRHSSSAIQAKPSTPIPQRSA